MVVRPHRRELPKLSNALVPIDIEMSTGLSWSRVDDLIVRQMTRGQPFKYACHLILGGHHLPRKAGRLRTPVAINSPNLYLLPAPRGLASQPDQIRLVPFLSASFRLPFARSRTPARTVRSAW